MKPAAPPRRHAPRARDATIPSGQRRCAIRAFVRRRPSKQGGRRRFTGSAGCRTAVESTSRCTRPFLLQPLFSLRNTRLVLDQHSALSARWDAARRRLAAFRDGRGWRTGADGGRHGRNERHDDDDSMGQRELSCQRNRLSDNGPSGLTFDKRPIYLPAQWFVKSTVRRCPCQVQPTVAGSIAPHDSSRTFRRSPERLSGQVVWRAAPRLGQITMRRVDGWPTLTAHLPILTSPPEPIHHAVPDPRRADFHSTSRHDRGALTRSRRDAGSDKVRRGAESALHLR